MEPKGHLDWAPKGGGGEEELVSRCLAHPLLQDGQLYVPGELVFLSGKWDRSSHRHWHSSKEQGPAACLHFPRNSRPSNTMDSPHLFAALQQPREQTVTSQLCALGLTNSGTLRTYITPSLYWGLPG